MAFESIPFAHSRMLGARADAVYARFLRCLNVPGDVAECGVYEGETSHEMVKYLERHAIRKTVHLFDSFEGLPDLITPFERATTTWEGLAPGQFRSSLDIVLRRMGAARQYAIHRGLFAETFADFSEPLCFIHADADLYRSTVEIIELADRCLVRGGAIVFDDYGAPSFPGIRRAIEERLDRRRYATVASPETSQYFGTKL